jgi:hypothetical protein
MQWDTFNVIGFLRLNGYVKDDVLTMSVQDTIEAIRKASGEDLTKTAFCSLLDKANVKTKKKINDTSTRT